MDKKFDFENIDVKLYLALRKVTADYQVVVNSPEFSGSGNWVMIKQCEDALEEFELSHGPLPEWAIGRNWDYSLVPGAQLCTKDGRRTGNAHIIKVVPPNTVGKVDVSLYHCLTDAGSAFVHSEQELLGQFTIGEWISDPVRVLKDFDRNDEFMEQPNDE